MSGINNHIILFLLLMGLLLSCDSPATSIDGSTEWDKTIPLTKMEEGFELNFGQKMVIEGKGLTIQFSDVDEDSRCPEGLRCVWAGNARIIIEINNNKMEFNTALNPREQSFNSEYTIYFLNLEPYPVYGEKIYKKNYTATLLINKI
jgi:hypothetical protein